MMEPEPGVQLLTSAVPSYVAPPDNTHDPALPSTPGLLRMFVSFLALQPQTPLLQTGLFEGHALQLPQWRGSLLVSTHEVPQAVPLVHFVHVLLEQ